MIHVVTNREVDTQGIWLPPCVPRQSKVFEHSEHPFAVKIVAKLMSSNRKDRAQEILRETTLFVVPEFTVPKKMNAATAVAATEVADAKTPAVADEKKKRSSGIGRCFAMAVFRQRIHAPLLGGTTHDRAAIKCFEVAIPEEQARSALQL